MVNREEMLRREGEYSSPCSVRTSRTRGRRYPEGEHSYRSAFQRDRDRIIHSSAFRRLEYKTQVFINHEGDYYRTRLTHTIEAAQITRTVARVLGLNEDLAETVALAHDLGHTPFGHAGEGILDELMRDYGGFEHNGQSLRIVEHLEERYPDFHGLNLCWELREGIAKHGPPYDRPYALEYGIGTAPSLEAQLVDFTDEIAYTGADIDDGLRSGLITPEELIGVAMWERAWIRAGEDHTGNQTYRRFRTIRIIIDDLVGDLIRSSADRISESGANSVEEVRMRTAPLVGFSEEVETQRLELKSFLFDNLYRHHRVVRMMAKAKRVVRDLFETYTGEPALVPPHVLHRHTREGEEVHRVIADYIAGMTDRFAHEEHKKLFDPLERV